MLHPNLDNTTRRILTENRKPLRTRLISVPKAVSLRDCGLDVNKPPIERMFGHVKQRRDAFVHCEPGTQVSAHGYIKEAAFHDVSKDLVVEAIDLTLEIICKIWSSSNGTPRPRWLPEKLPDGRIAGVNLALTAQPRAAGVSDRKDSTQN